MRIKKKKLFIIGIAFFLIFISNKLLFTGVLTELVINKEKLREPILLINKDISQKMFIVDDLAINYRGHYYIHLMFDDNNIDNVQSIFKLTCKVTQGKNTFDSIIELKLRKGLQGRREYIFSCPTDIDKGKTFSIEFTISKLTDEIVKVYPDYTIRIYRESSLWR